MGGDASFFCSRGFRGGLAQRARVRVEPVHEGEERHHDYKVHLLAQHPFERALQVACEHPPGEPRGNPAPFRPGEPPYEAHAREHDIFTVNTNDVILFGEAKYVANVNAYNSAIKQVNRFVKEERDLTDLPDLVPFTSQDARMKASNGNRGLIAGFSSTTISDAILEQHIKNNAEYKALPKDKETICVAVDVR